MDTSSHITNWALSRIYGTLGPLVIIAMDAFFIFIFFKNIFYRNIFFVSEFTVLYPYRPAGGGRDLYVIKI